MCHKHGVITAKFYKWKASYGRMDVSQARKLKDDEEPTSEEDFPLTIADAKRRLAKSLGVPESAVKITIEH